MAHWAKGLLHKHEEQNLTPQTHINNAGCGAPTCKPSDGEAELGKRQDSERLCLRK